MKMKHNVDEKRTELVPYLILDESADVEAFQEVMKKEGIAMVLEWRYYYAYKDAIRIIDFVETKGIYDGWAVFLPEACKEKADQLVQRYSTILTYFEAAEERFFRGLPVTVLQKALASAQMNGKSLELALKVLAEQNIVYSLSEVQQLKETLVARNLQKASQVLPAKILIWCLLIIIVVTYLYLVGMFG